MKRDLIRSITMTMVLMLLTAVAFPLAMTGIGQLLFHGKAEGSLVKQNGAVIGSALIGQAWEGPQWFYGRPSAIKDDASTSGASNLGPTSQALSKAIRERLDTILKIEGSYIAGLTADRIPVDLVTTSASGLDPDISPEAAALQAPRIAAVRGISIDAIRALIRAHTARPIAFGAPHVNVLQLNVALSTLKNG